jgi:hypothetical protein
MTLYVVLVLSMILIGLAIGTLFNFAFAFFAIPIVLVFFASWFFTTEGMQRQKRLGQMKKFRTASRARKVDFTDQDKRTLV